MPTANALLNGYLKTASIENLDGLAALPLFMSLRAAIRANVLLARIGQTSWNNAEIIRSARSYFGLAQQLIHPSAPALVAIGGLSGTGKSVLARALAPVVMPQPGAVVLRTDVLRKQYFAVNETDRLPESAYQPEATARIYELLAQRAVRILAQGHSVVVDAVFARESERAAIRDAARSLNARFVGLFLQAGLATRLSRLDRRKGDASDATPEIAGLQENYDIGAIDWTIIDASGTSEQTLKRCEAIFSSPQDDRPLLKQNSNAASTKIGGKSTAHRADAATARTATFSYGVRHRLSSRRTRLSSGI